MSHPDQIGMTLSISMAGYVLGGSSYFMALLFGGAWAGLIYYCCYEIYEGYRLRRMSTNMAGIQASFLDNPDNGFWVTEAEVNSKSKVAGVVGRRGGGRKGRWLERRTRRDRPRRERWKLWRGAPFDRVVRVLAEKALAPNWLRRFYLEPKRALPGTKKGFSMGTAK